MTTYKELAYLESTGTQYIDTGYIPTAKTSFDLFGVDMDYTTGMIRFGSRVDVTKENYCFTTIASSDFRFTYGSGQTTTSIQYIYSTHKLAKKVSFDASTKICTITFNDDTTESSPAFTTTPPTSAAQSIYLFAFNNSGTAVFGKSKQSGLKIYEDGVLVRDYIPVLDFNNTPAMYDKVNDVLYYNQGSGQFNYGVKETESSIQMRRKFNMLLASHKKPEYTPVKYIQSSGTQYIVSPLVLSGDNYKIECKYDKQPLEQTTMFGYQKSGSNGQQIMCIDYAPSNEYKGDLFWHGSTDTAGNQNRRKQNVFDIGLNEVVIEANNNTLTYNINGRTGTYTVVSAFQPQADTGVWIFGNSREAAAGGHQEATAKFYYLRIYQNNEIKYNFISVLDSKGVPCILETVSGVYYYNQGTGDFTYEEWDYTPCDYVYADGNAYLNTLWYGDENTATEVYVKSDDLAYRIAVGSRSSATDNNITSFVCDTKEGVVQDFGDYRITRQTTGKISAGNYVRCYNSKDERWIEEDGQSRITTTTQFTGTFTTPTPLFLGWRDAGTYPASCANFKGNYKEAKIYENGVLVRDLIPAVDGDNKGCFYDKTLNALFYSKGSSDFVGHFIENGVDYKIVKNIIAEQVATSTNTRACPFISTGIYPSTSKKTRMKAKASLSVATTSYEHYLGGTNAGSRFVVGQAGGSSGSKFYFGLGTKNYWTTKNVDTNTHIFGLDWATETCSIDDTTWQIPSAGTSESTKPFFINARNTAANANANRPGGGTSYWWKFYEGKKLVYNGIPVVRVLDNKVGLWETIGKQFQTTAGTVEYTYTE